MASVKSMARASASGLVFSPLMISTSCILSTGEKKWTPMKSSGRCTPVASSVMGRVDVLEPSRASGLTIPSISWKTFFFSSGDSKTASITVSQPARSCGSMVGVMRASRASDFSGVVRPRSRALASIFSE